MALNTHSLGLTRTSSQNASSANTTLLDGLAHATFEAWIKYASQTGGQHRGIIGKSEAVWVFNTYTDSATKFSIEFIANSKYAYNTIQSNSDTTTWHHIAVVYDGTQADANKVKAWLDGTSVPLTVDVGFPATLPSSNIPVNLGSWNATSYFDGLIDEVRIWNTSRSEAQIQANKDVQLTGSETGLVAYYKLNNAYTDSSSSGLTLTPANSPVFSTDVPFVGTAEASGAFFFSQL